MLVGGLEKKRPGAARRAVRITGPNLLGSVVKQRPEMAEPATLAKQFRSATKEVISRVSGSTAKNTYTKNDDGTKRQPNAAKNKEPD